MTMEWKEEGGVLHRWASLTLKPDDMPDGMPDQYSMQSPQSVVNRLVAGFRYAGILHAPIRCAEAGMPISIHASVMGDRNQRKLKIFFRVAGEGFRFSPVDMTEKERNIYSAVIPAQQAGATIWYFIRGADENAGSHGSEKEPHQILVYKSPMRKPGIRHTDVVQTRVGADMRVRAAVVTSAQLAAVRLHYRHLDQSEDWRVVEMKPRGASIYEAFVPGEFVTPNWDLMYAIEAVDNYGGGTFYPDFDRRQPFVVVPVKGP
jgi:hypothetical protein